MQAPEAPFPAAELHWDDRGQPISSRYEDVYFSRDNGLEESRYVFLEQNHLARRWHGGFPHDVFYIGETGFGSGLNLLAAWQLWNDSASSHKRLHFVSVENAPLRKGDLRRALALWPELSVYAEQLLAVYPELPMPGFHIFRLQDGQVLLTLIIADASEGLEQLLASDHPLFKRPLHGGMHAWFLDGFAPAKNPAMWQPALFDTIAALSAEDCTLATFTAAGLVKRELRRVGFEVEKRPGYGKKREMLAARMAARPVPDAEAFPLTSHSARFAAPWYVAQPTKSRGEAVVIGAGLAGCHTAHALARRGWQVQILEQADELASGASGNAQGIVYGKLSCDTDGLALFNLASLLFAQEFYASYWQGAHDSLNANSLGQQCGILQLAWDDKQAKIQAGLARRFAENRDFLHTVSGGQASDIAGLPMSWPGLYFPKLGWLNPPALCRQLVDHPAIQVQCGSRVHELTRLTDKQEWQVLDKQGRPLATAPVVIIASAHGALDFACTAHLPLKSIRGQVSQFPAPTLALKTVVCADGYIAPPAECGLQSFGATFTLHQHQPVVTRDDHQKNLATLAKTLPEFSRRLAETDLDTLGGRTGFRCTTPDYLPIVGPAPDLPAFAETFKLLSVNARAGIPKAGDYLPGLYLNVGHGSRGLAYTPLSAEMLAAQLNREVLPVARQLATALNPARFIVRDLNRRRRKG